LFSFSLFLCVLQRSSLYLTPVSSRSKIPRRSSRLYSKIHCLSISLHLCLINLYILFALICRVLLNICQSYFFQFLL
jgi:hypothetical protein